jgi:hypothetical protein
VELLAVRFSLELSLAVGRGEFWASELELVLALAFTGAVLRLLGGECWQDLELGLRGGDRCQVKLLLVVLVVSP